jgi:hypothetical protein
VAVPRRFSITNDCLSCTLKRPRDVCDLPQPAPDEFHAMGHLTLYPSNAALLGEVRFREESTLRVQDPANFLCRQEMARRSSRKLSGDGGCWG